MKLIFTFITLALLASNLYAQTASRTIFRYGEEVRIEPDSISQPKKFNAKVNEGKIYLSWSVANVTRPGMYVIERSDNGKDYDVIGFKKGVAAGAPVELSFYFTDREPLAGRSMYKVTHIADDNTYFEFEPVSVKIAKESKQSQPVTASSE